jgi:hypothetical protein
MIQDKPKMQHKGKTREERGESRTKERQDKKGDIVQRNTHLETQLHSAHTKAQLNSTQPALSASCSGANGSNGATLTSHPRTFLTLILTRSHLPILFLISR